MSLIIVPTKSKKDRDQLLTFMEREYRPWDLLCKDHPSLLHDKDHSEDLIEAIKNGVRVRSTALDSIGYLFDLMRWCTIRVGKREPHPRLQKLGIGDPMPSYLLAPNACFPVLMAAKDSPYVSQSNTRFCAVNPLGMSWDRIGGTPGAPRDPKVEFERKLHRKVVKQELSRLLKAWKEQ